MTARQTEASRQHVGRFEQTCPACGISEGAGSYCTSCLCPISAVHWHAAIRSARQIATTEWMTAHRPRIRREPGPTAHKPRTRTPAIPRRQRHRR